MSMFRRAQRIRARFDTMGTLLISLAVAAILAFSILIIAIVARSLVSGAPYVPSSGVKISAMVRLAGLKPGERVADFGSGDGRVVMALARAGAEAHGYEINPILVWLSRRKIRAAGLAGRARIHYQSFWRADAGDFDIITVFGISHIMPALGRKLRRELKSGARVVSNAFAFPQWPPARVEDSVYRYDQI